MASTRRDDANPGQKLTKGERTRLQLMASGRLLMEKHGYHGLKVTEVAREAGLSAGVFYIYFKDKDALALAIFGQLVEEAVATIFGSPAPADPFEAILDANRRYIGLILDGGGLMRAIMQMLDQLPEARRLWFEMNGRVARRVAAALERREPDAIAGAEARLFTAHVAQAMIDTILMNLVSYRNPDLTSVADDRERLVQATSVLWFRLLYGRSPTPQQCPAAIDFLPARSD
ncbi:MAG: TetR/AcrR family transcriptional regulator [Thermaurantiacus sp.]